MEGFNPEQDTPPEKLLPKHRILEIGVGGDPFRGTGYAPRHDLQNSHYVGIDPLTKERSSYQDYLDVPDVYRDEHREEYLRKLANFEAAREESARRHDTKIDYMQASGDRMPFPDATFDEVLIKNVVGDPRTSVTKSWKILMDAGRVLKEHGRIIIAENNTPEYAHNALDPQTIQDLGFTMRIYNKLDPEWDEVSAPFGLVEIGVPATTQALPFVAILQKRPFDPNAQVQDI